MTLPLILAYDVGTSATKATLVRADGSVLGSALAPHETFTPRPGFAEQDPAQWWAGVCSATEELLSANPDAARAVAAIGVSGHMLGALPVDGEGNPLRPSMIHADVRAEKQNERILREIGADALYNLTGNRAGAYSPLCKLLWIKENEPEVYRKTARFLQTKDYVTSRLTGNIDATDYSDASHAMLIDVRKRAYDPALFSALGIDGGKLPALYKGTDVVGRLTSSAAKGLGLPAGVPVVAGGGDGACASAGAGVASAGDIYCCLGTTAWIATVKDEPAFDGQKRIFDILSLDGEGSGVFGTMQAAGRCVQWAMELFGEQSLRDFDALAATAPAGSGGLVFLPYLEGERSPIFDSSARGVYFGLSPAHGRAHFQRAVMEGVAFALKSILDVFREDGTYPAIRLIGGGARSGLWRGILADILSARVLSTSAPAGDVTSLGVAMAAGVGAGIFRDLREASSSVAVTGEREPSAANAEAYARSYATYQALYPALRDVFAKREEEE